MDIGLLSRMLHELLLEHDQVGLPGVGTFVAEMAPACFADKGYIINPPFRKLVFHPDCLEDKLLVDFYAESNNVERSIADAYIKDFLEEMRKVLLERKSLSLPQLGRLRVTRSNNIFFIPAEDLDIYPEGFGLGPLSMKTHIETDDNVTINVKQRFYKAETEVMPEPVPEPEPRPARLHADEPELEETSKFSWWIIPVVILGLAAIAFCAFVIIAQINPEILYPILYSPEELEILYG